MSTKYKATTTEEAFFITITTVGWVDLFTRLNQKNIIINALQHCQKNKGLEIYAYCLMSSHIHLFCKATNGFILSDVLRDFKKFTSKKIIQTPTARICSTVDSAELLRPFGFQPRVLSVPTTI
jgi:REP element-mobilizing transposase RayT